MNQIKHTKEILTTKVWQIDPRFAHSVVPMIEGYLNRHESNFDAEENNHLSGWFALKSNNFQRKPIQSEATVPSESSEGVSQDLILTDDPAYDMTQHWWEEEGPKIKPEDEFINVIDLTSSVTRYGGWCSAGSIEHRDQMIFASKFPNCIGHIFIVDTPGGSAYAMNDYQQGIEAAREAGQPVITWIDGMCCSAGVAASCQTDEIYVQHPNCEVGCIGVMAAFYTLADGKEDEDGYVYHELYDPESFDKNREMRELANNNNPDPILEDLAAEGIVFRNLVKANRPAIKEDMLHGKVYKASTLMGILVDGVKSFEDCIQRIVDLNGGAEKVPHLLVAEPENTDTQETPEAPDNSDDPEASFIPPVSVITKGATYDTTPCNRPSVITKP